MSNLKKNLAYNFLLSCSQVLIPLISIPYVSRVLNPAGIGKVSFIDSLSYYFVIIAEFGIVTYGIREVARVQHEKDKLQKLVAELLVLHVLCTFFSLILYSIAVYALWQQIQDIRMVLFSVVFLISNAFTCEWYFMGTEQFKYITIRSLITRILGLVAMFLLVKTPSDYYIYYAIIIGALVLNQAANMSALFRQLPIKYKDLNWRRHLPSTSVIYSLSLFYNIIAMLDNVFLRIASTAAAVGIYAFSVKIVRMGSNVITDIFLVLYPRTAALLHEKNGQAEAVKQTILKSVQLITLITIPAGMGIFLLARPLVNVLLSDDFYPAAGNLLVLSVLPFIKTYNLFLGKQILISHNKEKLYLYSLVAGSIFFIVCSLVLSYYLHDRGACYALILAETSILIICYNYVTQYIPDLQLFDWRVFGQSLLVSALFIPVIWLIETNIASSLIVVILSVVICIPLYFLFQLFIMKNKLLQAFYKSGLLLLK